MPPRTPPPTSWKTRSVGKPKVVGLLVDAVSDILTVTDENMQPTPDVANEAAKAYARGILAIEGRMICLIELESLFPHTESEAA